MSEPIIDDSLRFPIACLLVLVLLMVWVRWETGEWIWQDPTSGRAHFECPLPAKTYYRIHHRNTGTFGAWHWSYNPPEVCP